MQNGALLLVASAAAATAADAADAAGFGCRGLHTFKSQRCCLFGDLKHGNLLWHSATDIFCSVTSTASKEGASAGRVYTAACSLIWCANSTAALP